MKHIIVFASAAVLLVLMNLGIDAGNRRSDMKNTVRKPVVAGQFYTGNPAALRAEVKRYLDEANPPPVEGEIVAIVSPHAGYMYSGHVAGHGFSMVRGKRFDIVVIISPCHVEYFGYSSIFPGKAYETPLGEVPVDGELSEAIAGGSDLVRLDGKGHVSMPGRRGEHALEVQLPFLQVALGDFKIVPIVMGDQSDANIAALGKAIGAALKDRKALIVASTDLSHFHDGSTAEKLDRVFIEKLESFDPDELTGALAKKTTEACGGGPTAAAMIAAAELGAKTCTVLKYANSGDVTGDYSQVVGYVSAVMVKGKEHSKKTGGAVKQSTGEDKDAGDGERIIGNGLTRNDKVFLLKLVRSVIESECAGRPFEPAETISPVLNELRGAFVTLKKDNRLRGCIGYIQAFKPLVSTIAEMAKAAAFNDHRFSPVKAGEVPELHIEISVLSPIERIEDPSRVEVGRHGLIITRGANRGLLLPQVATEWGWDRERFLEQTCLKAGLPVDAWKQDGTTIEVFTAEIFSEEELGLR